MASEWIRCRLADACSSIDYGLTASASETKMGPKFLRITDIVPGYIDWNTVPNVESDEAAAIKYKLHDGDIVLARTGASTGSSAYIKDPPCAVFASYLVRLQAKPEFDSRYVAYYLKSGTFWSFIRGVLGDKSAQPNASAKTMTQAPLHIPLDRKEQQAIAAILGALDDKIELNRRMNRALEDMARAIFKSWFVDFDPVRAKAAGSPPPGLAPHIAALFPDSFTDSPLGPIPAGWEVATVYRSAEVTYGAPFKSSLFNDDGDGVPLIRIRDLASHAPTLYTPECHPRGYLVSPGDLVVGMDGEFRAHLWGGPSAWLNQRLCCFKPRKGTPRAFLHYSLEGPLAFFERSKTGTTVIHLGKSDIDTMKLPTPPSGLLDAFGRIADPIDLRIVRSAQEAGTLAALRDALLPKLISGELRIPDAERIVGLNT